MSHTPSKQYYLITNVSSPSQEQKEIDLHAQSWKLPYSIEDADLTFDGKPLNMLYEENRWQAEHSGSRDGKKGSRGRRRESKK